MQLLFIQGRKKRGSNINLKVNFKIQCKKKGRWSDWPREVNSSSEVLLFILFLVRFVYFTVKYTLMVECGKK